MTNTVETEEWEELDSLDGIKVGDEIEYTTKGSNAESRLWGKVYKISDAHGTVVHVEGDWHLVDESLTVPDRVVLLTRKVAPFKFPTKIGAVIKSQHGDADPVFYVRIDERADRAVWVVATTGERWAEWELDLINSNATMTVISYGP